jgi:hypothetical protein
LVMDTTACRRVVAITNKDGFSLVWKRVNPVQAHKMRNLQKPATEDFEFRERGSGETPSEKDSPISKNKKGHKFPKKGHKFPKCNSVRAR